MAGPRHEINEVLAVGVQSRRHAADAAGQAGCDHRHGAGARIDRDQVVHSGAGDVESGAADADTAGGSGGEAEQHVSRRVVLEGEHVRGDRHRVGHQARENVHGDQDCAGSPSGDRRSASPRHRRRRRSCTLPGGRPGTQHGGRRRVREDLAKVVAAGATELDAASTDAGTRRGR